ncbi:MAG: PBP1A family penicillin-binding protein [Acidobacteria bacterium]|nr:PBP1A family penicillin-binding protein [Acidobacteriota bacterium]
MRIQVPRKAWWVRVALHPVGRWLVGATAGLALVGFVVLGYYWVKYSRLIDQKLRAGPFQSTSMIFSAPRAVNLGEAISPAEITAQLRSSGYGDSRSNRMGWFHVRPNSVEVFPGPDSFFDQEAGLIRLAGNRVSQIVSLRDNTERVQYLLEPELITNLSDRNREKRRLVRFPDLPKVLVDAVISAEDKRFFQHAGFDPLRVLKAAYVDVKVGWRREGASTLSMQLARGFWLDQQKTWSRKAAEVLITLQLEQRLSKEEIFEYYANMVDLGRRGSFAIHGFGQGAKVYFGKDVRQLTLPEAALLAGTIQRPSFTNPFRHPQRAMARRNLVLGLMRQNGLISEEQYQEAAATELQLAPGAMESSEAPFFVDLVHDELQAQFQDHDFQSETYRIYTTLDMNLQREAAEAVRVGLQEVDARVHRQRRFRREETPDVQVALIALDPQSGAVKALVGGRNYGVSQLNRALAKRQPGSSFKPFVYAAALNTALIEGRPPLTPATLLQDKPTTFWFDDKPYAPDNFKSEFHGTVTLRQALAKSLNVPTVSVAEMVGYGAVEDLAKQAGMNLSIQPTPAIALGAYEVTPLEIAGAYTVFANGGVLSKPNFVSLIRDDSGNVIYQRRPEHRQVLDPRVAYVMTNLMEEVLRSGTGVAVRGRGFVLPAAGKTGTSRDGWFAGFTSKLVCVVWVGFDDNRELNEEGAHSALPIWTEFMKRAHQFREYHSVSEFTPPDGVVSVEIDPATGGLATRACPNARTEVFLMGTQPLETCRLHGGGTRVASWEAPAGPPELVASAAPPAGAPQASSQRPPAARRGGSPAALSPPPAAGVPKEEKKRGFFRRLWGVFK